MKNPLIAIPAYKKTLTEFERISLVQCCKILKKHIFFLICPRQLDISAYEFILKKYAIDYEIARFDDIFFSNIEKYNELMLNANFYEHFANYDFMLIYQLDAYVFSDSLDYWRAKNYDYIGAPWFENFSSSDDEAKLLNIAGNGGFSLRKIDSFINLLGCNKNETASFISEYIKNGQNEDMFFSKFAKNIDNNFKVAPPNEAMRFSFECQPQKLYKMTNEKLPFGCHGWDRYDFGFWENFIDLKNVDFKKENKSNLEKISTLREKLDKEKERFENVNASLELIESQKAMLSAELSVIYASYTWKVALFLQKILNILIPQNTLRNKLAVSSFRMLRKTVLKIIEIKKRLWEIFLQTKNRIIKPLPRKKIKPNLESKKIVYIDHSYHNKTKSSDFLLNYLKEYFDVEIVYDNSWNGQAFPDLSFVDESYLGIVFFQNLPSIETLKTLKNDNLIFFPMYDQSGNLGCDFWNKHRNLKIINFSQTLHKKLLKWGIESTYIQYFPDPEEFIPGKKDEIFFWQRLTEINFDIIKKLFENKELKIHIHTALDPGQNFTRPKKTDEQKFQITYSDWFEIKTEMQDLIKQKGIYIAPRKMEGIGLSFLEAMAMGKAVVAIDNPTMNEYIRHNETGYLFNLKKPIKIELSHIEEIQRNTHTYMQAGYKKWEIEKKAIIDIIKSA